MCPVLPSVVAVQDEPFLSARPAPEWTHPWPWPAPWVRIFTTAARKGAVTCSDPAPAWVLRLCCLDKYRSRWKWWVNCYRLPHLFVKQDNIYCLLFTFFLISSQSKHPLSFFLIDSCRKNVGIMLYVFTSIFFSRLGAMKSLSDSSPLIKC